MNIGDYVRTEYGICKIIRELHDRFEIDNKIIFDRGIMVQDLMKDSPFDNNQITKSSPNIIDLIKKGDYVNGSKVIENNYCYIVYDDDFDFGELKMKGSLLLENQKIIDCGFEIKSVVTKEQYENMEYKI